MTGAMRHSRRMRSTTRLQGGVWSATPTPFTADGRLDLESIPRLVEHHVQLGVAGLMLAGTCGEGPWMRQRDRETLTRVVVESARGRIAVALQVTDNSAMRTLANIEEAVRWGGQVAVVAAPYFLLNAPPARLRALYREIVRHSPLPVGFYDRGAHSPYSVPQDGLEELLGEPNIVMVKDSSSNPGRRDVFLKVKAQRPELLVLNGDEFNCPGYLAAGYDGLLLGGGIFNARIAARIIAAVRAGDRAGATALQVRMTELMHRVYGRNIEYWLGGLKELLVQLGVFSSAMNLLGYEVPEAARAQIAAAVSGADGLGFRADLVPDASREAATA